MEYVPPIGGDPGDPYINANPGGGIDGSIVPAEAIEHPMREIEEVITGAGLTPDPEDLTQLRQALESYQLIPPGVMMHFGGPVAPTGYLLCDGAAVSRTTYAALFAAIGTNWGVGDGATTFNVPDLRGRTLIGVGTGAGLTARALAATVGAETHVITESEMPAHTHTIPRAVGGSGVAGAPDSASPSGTHLSSSTGGGAAHNNMQPSRAANAIIKT